MKEQQNNQTPPRVEGQKERTPQQALKRRKMIVFPLFFLAFVGCMWLIFAPNEEQTQQVDGFNTTLPTPEKNGIITNKRDAYIQEAMRDKEQKKMRSLEDFAFPIDETPQERQEREQRQLRMAPKPVETSRSVGGGSSSGGGGAFRSSVHAYEDINRELGSFYDEPAAREPEQTELQRRITELEQQLEQEQASKSAEQEQLALIEKSYEIASRYLNSGQNVPNETSAVASSISSSGKVAVQPVKQVDHNVVKRLSAPMPDSLFRAEFVKPRNWGFHTLAGGEQEPQRNSIRACVYQTVTVADGGEVSFRLLEPMMAGEVLIPANSVLTGAARISGERMNITIKAIQYAGTVIPVELMIYDLDGNEGISAPASEEINAVKEIAGNMGSGLGSSITINDDAGSQLLSDLGRSAIQGVSQYVSKKVRAVKVTLKAGYNVLLLPPLK